MDEMVHELLGRWEQMACNAMGNDFPKEEYFLKLTKETFKLLSHFDSSHAITNPITRILVQMQEYAVYCFISEKPHSIEMWSIVSGILYDFLNGFEYERKTNQHGVYFPHCRPNPTLDESKSIAVKVTDTPDGAKMPRRVVYPYGRK